VSFRLPALALSLSMLVVAACGGGAASPLAPASSAALASVSPGASAPGASAPGASAPGASVPAASASAAASPATSGAVPSTTASAAASAAVSSSPAADGGPIGFRIVHLYRHPDGTAATLDIYARPAGSGEARPVQAAAPVGTVTDYIHPPAAGGVIAIETGDGGDLACVAGCTHFVLDTTLTAGEGNRRTVLIYPESRNFINGNTPSDLAGTLEFWEDATSVGQFGNALMPLDPSRGLLFVVGAAVDEARFGLRVAYLGTTGCQENLNLPGGMVGGNQVPAYAIEADVEITFHSSSDQDCSDPPVGGPFPVSRTPGSRAYLFLHGTLADLDALLVPID
jgi:hypothetical protein